MGRKLKVECECGNLIGDSPYKQGSLKICRRCALLPHSSGDIRVHATAGRGRPWMEPFRAVGLAARLVAA